MEAGSRSEPVARDASLADRSDPRNPPSVRTSPKRSKRSVECDSIRRYLLRSSALEFFMVDQTNFFLNFEKSVRDLVFRKVFSFFLSLLLFCVLVNRSFL
jgi:hypothetical protein